MNFGLKIDYSVLFILLIFFGCLIPTGPPIFTARDNVLVVLHLNMLCK